MVLLTARLLVSPPEVSDYKLGTKCGETVSQKEAKYPVALNHGASRIFSHMKSTLIIALIFSSYFGCVALM